MNNNSTQFTLYYWSATDKNGLIPGLFVLCASVVTASALRVNVRQIPRKGIPTWAAYVIFGVGGCCVCCCCLIVIGVFALKKKRSGGGGGGSSKPTRANTNNEMQMNQMGMTPAPVMQPGYGMGQPQQNTMMMMNNNPGMMMTGNRRPTKRHFLV